MKRRVALCPLDVYVNPLVVFGDISETGYTFLRHLKPIADCDFLADQALEFCYSIDDALWHESSGGVGLNDFCFPEIRDFVLSKTKFLQDLIGVLPKGRGAATFCRGRFA